MNKPKLGQLWGLGLGPDDPNTWYYVVTHIDDKIVKLQFLFAEDIGVYQYHYCGEIVEQPLKSITGFSKLQQYQWYHINGT
jgi:hypothetical protein